MKTMISPKGVSTSRVIDLWTILVLAVTLCAHAPLGHAQWSRDSTVNIPLSDTLSTSSSGSALAPRAVTDGNGGAIIVWYHGGLGAITGQRVNSNGNILWMPHGTTVGSSREPNVSASLRNSVLISDGSGGAIIAWNESSQRTIGASRVGPDGTLIWDRLICYTIGLRANPALASDGAGGAIITWQDARNAATNLDIYAQRVSAAGAAMWDSNGVAVCTALGNQELPTIAADGNSGAFITWQDSRTAKAIYAQRINSLGQVQWRANGIPVRVLGSIPGPSLSPKIVATTNGEAIIVWEDGREGGGAYYDIYAQKVNLDTVVWTAGGVPICNAPFNQNEPAIVANGLGGAIVTWSDNRTSNLDPNIYAQSITGGGSVQWASNGIPICTLPDRQVAPAIASDGQGGAVIAWEDSRSGTNYDIYAQRVNSGGSTLWTNNGRAVCVAPQDQRSVGITGDGSGGAIIAWADYRNNTWFVIYAQRVRANGSLGGTTSVNEETVAKTFRLEQNYPNPFNPSTEIRFSIPVGTQHVVSLRVFDVLGREVATLVNKEMNAGSYQTTFSGKGLASGVYFYRLTSGGQSLTKKLLLTK